MTGVETKPQILCLHAYRNTDTHTDTRTDTHSHTHKQTHTYMHTEWACQCKKNKLMSVGAEGKGLGFFI